MKKTQRRNGTHPELNEYRDYLEKYHGLKSTTISAYVASARMYVKFLAQSEEWPLEMEEVLNAKLPDLPDDGTYSADKVQKNWD